MPDPAARPVEFGVFLPVGQGGFIVSTTRPHTPATYAYNRRVTRLAEELGLGFVISQARWRGFGGPSGHNDVTLESVTTSAGLAEATRRIKIFCTIHTMAFHPAVAAKMVATIDEISGGRVGVNLVAGSNPIDHGQMGIWRDLDHAELYDVAREWITVANRLWTEERVDFDGAHYHLVDCMSNPKPVQKPRPPILCAATSDTGMRFTLDYADASLVNGVDVEDLRRNGLRAKQLSHDAGQTGRTVGLVMLVAGQTDAAAQARVRQFNAGADLQAMATRAWETLVGQGLTLRVLIRLLRIGGDETAGREEVHARTIASAAAVARLEELAEEWPGHLPLIDTLRSQYVHRATHLSETRLSDDGSDDSVRDAAAEQELLEHRVIRHAVIDAERDAVLKLRERGEINDETWRRLERDLDLEELRMEA